MTWASNVPGIMKCLKTEEILIHSKLRGAAGAVLTENEPFAMGSIVTSMARTSEGVYTFVFTHKFPQTVMVFDPVVRSATPGVKARWTALDLAAGTGTLRVETDGPQWSAATVVTAHATGALPSAGQITAVELVAGGVTGAGNLRDSAPAVTRDVRVVYTAGVPALTFLAGDAVTSCKYQQIGTAVDLTTSDDVYIGFVVRNSAQH